MTENFCLLITALLEVGSILIIVAAVLIGQTSIKDKCEEIGGFFVSLLLVLYFIAQYQIIVLATIPRISK